MGSVPAELSFDFRPTFVPKTISNFLKEVSLIGNVSDKVSKLDAFVEGLEEEMRKIDAFKRELPLSMLLLNDAIVALKEDSMQCRERNVEPVVEEFIPKNKTENNYSENGALILAKKAKDYNNNCNNYNDKKNWMRSFQLWNTDLSSDDKLDTKVPKKTQLIQQRSDEDSKLRSDEDSKNRGVRAFMPFKANLDFAVRKDEKDMIPVHRRRLLSSEIKNMKEKSGSMASRASCSRAVSLSVPNAQSNFLSGPQPLSYHQQQQQQQQQQNARKQRRCWSPELHRRFVNALQQLGGSQVATPKQIRELMQVDSLTNDEVKSHLQKYRLHTRRLPPSTTTPANQSVVVLGSGMWMSKDQYGDSSKGSSSQSGSPQGPLQLATNTGGTSTTGGDSMENDEDAKSEGYSWKSHIHKPRKYDV